MKMSGDNQYLVIIKTPRGWQMPFTCTERGVAFEYYSRFNSENEVEKAYFCALIEGGGMKSENLPLEIACDEIVNSELDKMYELYNFAERPRAEIRSDSRHCTS
jgi:hypothetical protein